MPKSEHIVRYSAEEMRMSKLPSRSDWERATRMTEEEIEAAIASDPTNATWWSIGRRLSREFLVYRVQKRGAPQGRSAYRADFARLRAGAAQPPLQALGKTVKGWSRGLNRRRLFP